MIRNHPILVLFLLILLILGTTQIINSFLSQSLEEKKPAPVVAKAPVGAATQPAVAPVHKTYPLIPSDPAKYGIIVQDPAETPKTPEQWDLFMEQALQKNKVLEQEGAAPAIEVMKKKPEEFAARQKEIEDRIKLFEEKRNDNPSDEDAEHHLKELYMLRSLGKILKDKVTASPRDDIKLPEGLFPSAPATEPSGNPPADNVPAPQLTP